MLSKTCILKGDLKMKLDLIHIWFAHRIIIKPSNKTKDVSNYIGKLFSMRIGGKNFNLEFKKNILPVERYPSSTVMKTYERCLFKNKVPHFYLHAKIIQGFSDFTRVRALLRSETKKKGLTNFKCKICYNHFFKTPAFFFQPLLDR